MVSMKPAGRREEELFLAMIADEMASRRIVVRHGTRHGTRFIPRVLAHTIADNYHVNTVRMSGLTYPFALHSLPNLVWQPVEMGSTVEEPGPWGWAIGGADHSGQARCDRRPQACRTPCADNS
jgi:hypothetical protein